MLKSFVATNDDTGEARTFNIDSAYSDSIRVKSIDGLDPVEATVLTTQYAYTPGLAYQGSVIPGRNIVLTLKFEPNYASESVQSLRDSIYTLFQQKAQVTLTLTRDTATDPTVYIRGYVDKIAAPLFSQEPLVQISMIFPYPYFTSTSADDVITHADTNSAYLGDIRGTAPAPYELKLAQISGKTLSSIYIGFRVGKSNQEALTAVGASVATGSYVSLRNIPGARSLFSRNTDASENVNLLERIVPGAAWPELRPKAQSILAYIVNSDSSVNWGWTMVYTPRFLGV